MAVGDFLNHACFFQKRQAIPKVQLNPNPQKDQDRGSSAPWIVRLSTNNILVDQAFVFEDWITINMFDGTPIGRYGATFAPRVPAREDVETLAEYRQGGSHDFKDKSPTTYVPSDQLFKKMKSDIDLFFERHKPSVFLMTTSVLSLKDAPHVGSFQNRDFKENMFVYAQQKGVIYPQEIRQ